MLDEILSLKSSISNFERQEKVGGGGQVSPHYVVYQSCKYVIMSYSIEL